MESEFGASLVSRNIYENKGKLKRCVKWESVYPVDNGWHFISDIDTDEYLANNGNWLVVAYEEVIEIESAVLAIYDMPVGTDLTLVRENGKMFFVDSNTGNPIELPYLPARQAG